MGRPTIFRQKLADEICIHIASGGSLRAYCAMEGKPHFSTVYIWLEKDDLFPDAYARAREVQAHNDADRMNEIVELLQAGRIAPDVARVWPIA
jgi:hypothetical protein